MKKTYLLLLIFQFSIASFGQTKVDEFLKVKFPCDVIKKDTLISNINVLNYYCENNGEIYSLQRIIVDSIQDGLNSLPSDLESLKKFYIGAEKGFTESMSKNGFKLYNSKEFAIDKYLGLQASYSNPNTNSKVIESRFILLNEYMYSIMYMSNTSFNETNKNNFLNSLKINTSKNPQQFPGNSTEYKIGYVVGQFAVFGLFIFGIVLLIKYLRRKK